MILANPGLHHLERIPRRHSDPHPGDAAGSPGFQNFIEVPKYLSGADCPATKEQLVEHGARQGAPQEVKDKPAAMPAVRTSAPWPPSPPPTGPVPSPRR
jgi:hypothetical protein